MSSKKPAGIYRTILGEAMRLTWSRKTLWVFGLFAGLISTGGVVDIALQSLQRASTQGLLLQNFVDRSFVGYHLFGSYIEQMKTLGVTHVSWIVTAATLAVIGVWVLGVLSQTIILLNAKSLKPKKLQILRKEAASHFWDVFVIDVLTKLCSLVLVSVASLPFVLYLLENSTENFFIVFLHTLIFLPLIVVLHIISMLAMIDIVDHATKPLDAIATSLNLFRRHWIATFEFGLLLFLIVLTLGLALLIVASLLMIPYAVIYTSALLTGSLVIFYGANILFGVLLLGVVLVFAGAIVTFQYTAWHRFYKRGMHKQHGMKVFSKMLRWLRP